MEKVSNKIDSLPESFGATVSGSEPSFHLKGQVDRFVCNTTNLLIADDRQHCRIIYYRLASGASSENDNNNAWVVNFNGDNGNDNKNNQNRARCVLASKRNEYLYFVMQLNLFDPIPGTISEDIPLHELFDAYFSCRRNKRKTMNALAFEADYEDSLVELHRQLNDGSYHVGRSITFVVDEPVKREIFAADFRDRVVHHLIINKLSPLFEKAFIYDSYACREGKGTLFGIRRVDRFIRQCSDNYRKDCYILKLDIKSFFMHIDRRLLFEKLHRFINEKYKQVDKGKVLELVEMIIFNDPTNGCVIKGGKNNWRGLPSDKSLFNAEEGHGLPIGNLTSQVFANYYMNDFDHWMKTKLGLRYYGRYVDDFICIHEDKDYLKSIVPLIRDYLCHNLGLTLHPDKIYLQHYHHGVKYLGAVIKPYRMYSGERTVKNYRKAIAHQNMRITNQRNPETDDVNKLLCSLNSYLGYMKHYKSYHIRRSIASHLSDRWWLHVSTTGQCRKFVKNRYYTGIPVPVEAHYQQQPLQIKIHKPNTP